MIFTCSLFSIAVPFLPHGCTRNYCYTNFFGALRPLHPLRNNLNHTKNNTLLDNALGMMFLIFPNLTWDLFVVYDIIWSIKLLRMDIIVFKGPIPTYVFAKSPRTSSRCLLFRQVWRKVPFCQYKSIIAFSSVGGNGNHNLQSNRESHDREFDRTQDVDISDETKAYDEVQDISKVSDKNKNETSLMHMVAIDQVHRIQKQNVKHFLMGLIVGLSTSCIISTPAVRSVLTNVNSGSKHCLACVSQPIILKNNLKPKGLFVLTSKLSDTFRSFSQVFYMLDLLLEKNPATYLSLLFLVCVTMVVIGGVMFYKSRGYRKALQDCLWDSWSCICSSSNHLKETTSVERFVGLMLGIGGMLFYSLLISTMTNHFRRHMERLKEGAHFEAMESGHVLICGINSHLETILKQIEKSCEYSQKLRRRRVLVLTEERKKDVEKLFANSLRNLSHIDVLFRSGSLSDTKTFKRAAAERARMIIILSRKSDRYEADADTMLSVLALKPLLDKASATVVAQVSEPITGDFLKSLCGSRVKALTNLSPKLFVQCSRQPGLLKVYQRLLKHGNQVFQLHHYPNIAGLTYWEVRHAFPKAIVCGIYQKGKMNFHPHDNLIIEDTDKLLIIAREQINKPLPQFIPLANKTDSITGQTVQENSKLSFTSASSKLKRFEFIIRRPTKEESKTGNGFEGPKECILMLGWRPGVREMISEYDSYVGPGSQLVILAEASIEERKQTLKEEYLKTLKNVNVVHKIGNPMDCLDSGNAIKEISQSINKEDKLPLSIVVVSDNGSPLGDPRKSDKQSLYALLLAEKFCREENVQVAGLVAEFLDINLGEQVANFRNDITYIGTEELMGLVTAQVTEHSELEEIRTDLLNSWGDEIYVKNIDLYVKNGHPVSFSELSERAILRNEVAIGYISDNKTVINPEDKSEQLTFGKGDSLVVISEFENADM